MKKVAVILSGSGVKDGSEIHESVLALWALAKNGIKYECFAPDKNQYHVINHLTGEASNEERNVLVEAARIARGKIKSLDKLSVNDFDALLFPGGLGAAKNLSTYAYDSEKYSVDNEVRKVVKDFHTNKKPILALCIAPMILAKVLGAKVTIGNDPETARIIEMVGAKHENKNVDEISIDKENLIITTPCYMLTDNVYEISIGIEAAVKELKNLID